MHESDSFTVKNFWIYVSYSRSRGSGRQISMVQLHNKYTYMLIFPCVFGTEQSPEPNQGKWKWQVKKIFFPLFHSTFHAELKCCVKGDPTEHSGQKNNLSRVLSWRGRGQVTPGDWTSCKAQKPLRTVLQVKGPNPGLPTQPLLPDYTCWIGSLTSPNTLCPIRCNPSSVLASSDSLTLGQRPGDGPSLETPMTYSWAE